MTDQDFDGCNSECRRAGKHTLRWGGCERAPEPEPTVSMSVVYTDYDGQPSIGFDVYTVPELARLIEPAVGDPLKAAAAALAIVYRNDPAPGPVAANRPGLRERHHAEWTALTDAERAARLAELDQYDEPAPFPAGGEATKEQP